LGKLHPRYDTPYYAIWISGIVMALLALTMDLTRVVALSTFGQLVYYALANISDLRLRSQKGVRKKMVPMLGAVSCLGLLVFLFFISPESWIAGLAGLILGSAYYILTSRLNLRDLRVI
jgi:APA family basic amino acid/polyamine antiporter